MKAIVKEREGKGFVLKNVDEPEIKQPDELLIKIKAASICGTDVHIYDWTEWAKNRIKPPLIVGHEFSGEVVEVGSGVKRFRPGDFVSAETHIYCGHCRMCLNGNHELCENLKVIGVDRDGVFTEYVVLPERVVWKNPPDISEEVASIQEPLGNALDTVLAEDISGKSVAIVGVGPIGLMAVALSRVLGATKIFVSDLSDYHLNLSKKLGADVTVNVKKESFVERVMDETKGMGVDVGLEMSGSEAGLKDLLKVVSPLGRISLLGIFDGDVKIDITNDVVLKKLRLYGIHGRKIFGTWFKVRKLLSSGKLDITPVITHKFKLEDFEKGFEVMKNKESGKVILIP